MRLGLISDIHCNLGALEIALDQMSGRVDEILCAGDAIFQFRFSNEVVAKLREVGARMVLGNHEDIVLSRHGERVRAHPQTDPELLRWLAQQPRRIDTVIEGKRLTMFHATPEEPRCDYVYAGSARMQEFGELGADYVIYGHTHQELVQRVNGTLVVNPGSTGQPRNPGNGFRVSYAILDTQSGEVSVERFDDPTRPRQAVGGSR
ncbi:MAG: metallophosphoesterase family protein [Chloroflexi bacterium]|nr:metallophosphoesterase family protein [Chloroflexota bacterium]MQC27904.1 metallophosphoesterase [Chloroflexota bacterium]